MRNIDELDIIIRQTDGKAVAGIPQIALYATAPTIADALERLEQKKAAVKQDIAAAGFVDMPSAPAADGPKRGDNIGRFAIKSAIVMFFVLLAFVVSGVLVANRIEGSVKRIVGTDQLGGREFWAGVERSLERAANPANDMIPEKKQKLLSEIRVIVSRWQPFVAEIMPLFAPTATQPD